MAGNDVLDRVTESVTASWQRALNLARVPHDAHFATLGGDSLLLLSVLTELELEFDVELDTEEIVKDLTVDGMVRVVLAATG